MTRHATLRMCLGGSPAGIGIFRLCTLTLAAVLIAGGAMAGFGQTMPNQDQPAAKPVTAKKPAAPADKTVGGYLVHQSIEVGGRVTNISGSGAMWDTLVNQSSGGRVLGQSLEMHSVDTSRTPFFDSLTTTSTGYGGDPYDVTRLKLSKGRWYDFTGSFRRDRNYFDYNQWANSMLTTYTATAPVLVAEPDTLHLFNTVRRNTDTTLTLLPLSFISFRAGFNHGTHEGPTLTTVHNGGDVPVAQWFRNGSDTYTGGVDLKLAKRTTLSYDQFFVAYKGDSFYNLAGTNLALSNGTPVSLGVDVLGGATTCGSATAKPVSTLGPEVVNGIVNPYCTGSITQRQTTPARTSFPTEQLRFSSHYWDRFLFNGRLLYSGGTSTINNFNETFNGLGRGNVRQTIETGAGANNQFADNKRINTNGDFGVIAEVNKYLEVSDSVTYWDVRNEGNIDAVTDTWTGTAGSAATKTAPAVPTTSMLTPLTDPSITYTTPATIGTVRLRQQIEQNTLLATATLMPEFKLSAGWRFKNREISDSTPIDLVWHENGLLLGAVMQPSRMVRINVNFESMGSSSASAATLANTFTREAPNRSYRIRARATIKPASWITFAVAGNDYSAENDDPLVNHLEHNHDFSFATTINPTDKLSLDFNYAYDDAYSTTSICYEFAANANFSVPAGAVNAGTCTLANSPASSRSGGGTATTSTTPYLLGNDPYNAPSNFYSGSINYAPVHLMRINAGARVTDLNGTANFLNPLLVPGALQSRYLVPFSDVLFNIAPQWAWHGNWTYSGYGETGPANTTIPVRNVHGNVLTLGVKYAF